MDAQHPSTEPGSLCGVYSHSNFQASKNKREIIGKEDTSRRHSWTYQMAIYHYSVGVFNISTERKDDY